MADQDRTLNRLWEVTKDISIKVSKKAEKHWKVNTLRVEIASIKHRISVKYKELGRYVYESSKSDGLDEGNYKSIIQGFFGELSGLENDIYEREQTIERLEAELQAWEREFEENRGRPRQHESYKSDPYTIDAPAEEVDEDDDEDDEDDDVRMEQVKKKQDSGKKAAGKKESSD